MSKKNDLFVMIVFRDSRSAHVRSDISNSRRTFSKKFGKSHLLLLEGTWSDDICAFISNRSLDEECAYEIVDYFFPDLNDSDYDPNPKRYKNAGKVQDVGIEVNLKEVRRGLETQAQKKKAYKKEEGIKKEKQNQITQKILKNLTAEEKEALREYFTRNA